MFRHACAFADCADMAEAKFRHDTADIEWYTTPAIVNSAFACEVYLKAILLYNGISPDKIHKIGDLYAKLPDSIKDFVRMTTANNHGGIWTDNWGFELLENISDAFREWRYSYEHDWGKSRIMHIDISFLKAFRNALREACCELFFSKTWEEYQG